MWEPDGMRDLPHLQTKTAFWHRLLCVRLPLGLVGLSANSFSSCDSVCLLSEERGTQFIYRTLFMVCRQGSGLSLGVALRTNGQRAISGDTT